MILLSLSRGGAYRALLVRAAPCVFDESEIRLVLRPSDSRLALGLPPLPGVDRRKTDVALGLERHLCDGEAIGAPDRLGVKLAPARDHDRLGPHRRGALPGEPERRLEAMGDAYAFSLE